MYSVPWHVILHMSRQVATSWLVMSPAVQSRDSNHLRITAFVYVKCNLDASIMTHLGNPFVLNCLRMTLKTHLISTCFSSAMIFKQHQTGRIKHLYVYTFHMFGWGSPTFDPGLHGFHLEILSTKTDPMWPWKLLQKSVGSPDMMILVRNNPCKMNVGHFRFLSSRRTYTLPETKPANLHLKNGGLEDDPFLLGWLPGRCYVRFREGRLW